jgi:hypothetical protein
MNAPSTPAAPQNSTSSSVVTGHAPFWAAAARDRWSEERADAWYRTLPWLVGCNFIPSDAINQLEMWQEDSFHPELIDRELGWLAGLGMNMARVFLHDIPWQQDARGFLERIERFLEIAERHGFRILFVFFDSCWDPEPQAGKQRAPVPHVHNSYWVQSPGPVIVNDPEAFARLEDYVTGVTGHFCNDARVLAWDVWNEPENIHSASFEALQMTSAEKADRIAARVAGVFEWIRSVRPSQPLTAGVWTGDWSSDDKLIPLHQVQLFASDIISFHTYQSLAEVRPAVSQLRRFNRPRQHRPDDPALFPRGENCRLQLGRSGGQDPDAISVGLLADNLHGGTSRLAPRHSPCRRLALRSDGDGVDPVPHQQVSRDEIPHPRSPQGGTAKGRIRDFLPP